MGDGVNLAVRAQQRRHLQRVAEQIGGIAQSADGDVEPRAMARKRRYRRGNHPCGDICRRQGSTAGIYAEALQHADQALLGKDGVGQTVTGAVEADNQAVAGQQIGADAFEISDVLDPRARFGGRSGEQQHNRTRRESESEMRECPVEVVFYRYFLILKLQYY